MNQQPLAIGLAAVISGRALPHGSGGLAIFQQPRVERAHASDAKLIVRTFQRHAAVRGRVERDVADGRAQAGRRQRKIFQRSAHENAGGVHRLLERRLAIDQQYAQAVACQQVRALQPSQAGPHHYDVEFLHGSHFGCSC